MNRVVRALFEQQNQNLRKGKSTSYRYTSELALDFSFEVWFRGGMISRVCVRVLTLTLMWCDM